jgi:hypothetical protein
MESNYKFNYIGYKRAIEERLTIINKNKQEVPFVLNPAQNDIMPKLTLRNLILKARKLGFSSLLESIATIKFLLGDNERCVTMSFDQDASQRHLERVKHYIYSFEHKNNVKIPFKYNSKNEMVYERILDDGRKVVNTFRIGTARSDSFGRGDDITFLHLTEVSQADSIEKLLSGVTQALVNDAMATFESTANGFNSFKTFWDDSVAGLTGFTPFFYNPTWEYSKEFLDAKKMELGRLFPQEYPMTAEEAFVSSGDPYFDRDALQWYLTKVIEPMNRTSQFFQVP